jgi:hypothetical protein
MNSFEFLGPRSVLLVLLVVTLIAVFIVPRHLTAQQPQSAQVTFQVLERDLANWAEFQSSIVTIEITNPYRPSESSKRIVLSYRDELRAQDESIEITRSNSYPLSAVRQKWFSLARSGYLSVSEFASPDFDGTISFSDAEGSLYSAFISVPLNPGTYKVSAKVQSAYRTIDIVDVTQGYHEGRSVYIPIKEVGLFERFWQLLFSREGLLASAVLALASILIGVLRDNIKTSFNKLLDVMGKYVGGRLAERRFLKRYLENLIFNHKYLKLIGFNTAGISRPLLEAVFVSLRIASSGNYESSNSPGSESFHTISFSSAFKRYRCMAILGGPGAGKTTTLSYTLLAFAKGTAKEQLGIGESLVPIYIPLRRLTNSNRSIVEEVTDKDTQILSAEILKEYPANYFERKLKKGECLLLLDGLDEVIDEKTHRQIAERINGLVAAYPGNRFLVTCRVAGWKDLLSGDFTVFSAQEFDREEIQRFVLGWHKAVITQSEYSKLQVEIPDKKKFDEAWEGHREQYVRPAIDIQSRSLINAIDSNNRILAIAVNPMLLSLISLVHFNRQFLPRGRTVLYSQCLDLLIDSWDRSRDIMSHGKGVTAIQKEAVLREIAFDFQARGRGEDSRENLEGLIKRIALKLGISTDAKELLEDIENRSGLLTERSLDVFGFSHLTLQEYLVAKHIQLNQGYVGLLERNFDNQAWREVILLYTGLVDDATELITGVASSDSIERQLLAGYCIGDARHCSSEVAQTIIERLLADLTKTKDGAEEIVNGIAAIAADFQTAPVSVEERLSSQLIDTITGESPLAIERLHAITILGRARVTRALPVLIISLSDNNETIRQSIITAIIQFGDLALPTIEQGINHELNPRFTSLIDVLTGINTGSSALSLLRFYEHALPELDRLTSLALVGMITNPLVETELLDLDANELPQTIKSLPIDRNGWSFKSVKSGIWHLDTKLRRDVEVLLADLDRNEHITPGLNVASFKILFPAVLSYLKSWPKDLLKQSSDAIERRLRFLTTLGFDKGENSKLLYLIDQVQRKFEMPLDLALQRISKKTHGESSPSTPRGHRLWIQVANTYFVLFFLTMVYFDYTAVRFINHSIEQRRTMATTEIVSLTFRFALLLIYVAAVVITKYKLKKRFLSAQFLGIVFNPIGNSLKVLPYITKLESRTKLTLFLVGIICLSPFPFLLSRMVANGFGPFVSIPIVFNLISPVLITPLTLYYWKHRVLAQNPVFELMMMHPQGRQLIGETN